MAEYKKKSDFISDSAKMREAKRTVLERFSASSKYTQSYFVKFQDYYELYRSHLQKGRLPWRTNLFIPKTFEIIETIAPRISQAQRRFVVLPVEASDVDNAEAFDDLLKYQFAKTGMEQVIEELVKETLIYGTGVMKISWGGDMPFPEVVDIFDFFPDPKARNLKEAKYVIHRVNRDIEDLKANPNYDKRALKRLERGDGNSQDSPERRGILGVTGVTSDDTTRKRFEVLEYWGEFDGEQYLIVVAGGEVLRCEKNPYDCGIPFVIARDHIVPHQLYGIGEIEPIESLQNELNDVRNQRMDNVKLNLNNMWKVVSGGVQYETELVSRPGGVIHLTRPDGLLPNDRQPIDASAFTEEAIIKSDAERATGANSSISGALVSPMGGTSGGVLNRTATAYQGAINQGDKRFASKVNQIKFALIDAGTKFLKLNQQFMLKEQAIRVLGKDGEPIVLGIGPEDIKGGFDLDVEVEYIDDFQKMQANLQLLQSLATVHGIDTAKWVAEQIFAKSGVKNYKDYLLPPQPPRPEDPKINLQLKGELSPDATAQIINKHEGIRSNPEMVASMMRAKQKEETMKQAEIRNTQAQTMSDVEDVGEEQQPYPNNEE